MRSVLVCAGSVSILVATAGVAAIAGGYATDASWNERGFGASVPVAVALFAFRWGAVAAVVGVLPLGKWGGSVVTVTVGWLLPQSVPSFYFLDPGAPLRNLEHNSQTFVGCLADTGAILAFGMAAILLERRFRPTS